MCLGVTWITILLIHFQVWWQYIYLIYQARGPYWENIRPRSWQYGPSIQKRPRADILPGRSRASLVNKKFITRLKLFRRKTQMIDRLKRHHKLQACNFYLEQTERLLTSDVFKKKRNKLKENKNNILCGVNTFRKKEVKLRENLRVGSLGTVSGPILREYWTDNGATWLADFSYWLSELT